MELIYKDRARSIKLKFGECMCNQEEKARFFEWVSNNYGEVVCSLVKSEFTNNPCTKAALFKKLYKVLANQDVKDMKCTFDFGNIRYNSF